MHIEITGPSGAGKSTIARNLRYELERRDVTCNAPAIERSEQSPSVRDRVRHVRQMLGYGVRHPLSTIRIFYYCVRWGLNTESRKIKFIFRQFFAAIGIRVKQVSTSQVSVTDHGIIAKMAIIGDSTVVEGDTFYKRLLELVYPPEQPKVILRVETEPQVVIERGQERIRQGWQRYSSKTATKVTVSEVKQRYKQEAQVIDTMDNLYNATSSIVVDGAADPKANAAEIIAVAVELDKKLQDEENILPKRVHREFE